MVPYVVGALVAVTVMHVLLFVLDVSMVRECEGDGNARDECGMRGVSECVKCVCVWLEADKSIDFGLCQSCGNRRIVGRVCVLVVVVWGGGWLVGLGQGLEAWGGVMSV